MTAFNYDPMLGRITTVDPLEGIPGQVTISNPYHYANNDPLNQIDPLGLRPLNDSDMRLISNSRGRLGWPSWGEAKSVWGGMHDSGWGVISGTRHLVTNPTQLWRVPESAYRDFGGGWGGTFAAINQFNPLFHGLNNSGACMNAVGVRDSHGVGYGCTNLILDAAGAAALAAGGAGAASRGVSAIKGRTVFDERGSIGGGLGQPVPAPRKLEAFRAAERVKPKPSVQGGGGLRQRWKDPDGRIYEWDRQHGTVEVYDKRGRHIGEVDASTGDRLKPASPTRRVEP